MNVQIVTHVWESPWICVYVFWDSWQHSPSQVNCHTLYPIRFKLTIKPIITVERPGLKENGSVHHLRSLTHFLCSQLSDFSDPFIKLFSKKGLVTNLVTNWIHLSFKSVWGLLFHFAGLHFYCLLCSSNSRKQQHIQIRPHWCVISLHSYKTMFPRTNHLLSFLHLFI